jgi:hypothetical protein
MVSDVDIPDVPARLNGGLIEALNMHIPVLAVNPIVVEIGAELGGSTRIFLESIHGARVVSIDPWPKGYNIPQSWSFLKPAIAKYGGGSLLPLYLHYCRQYKERLTPVREFSSDGLQAIYNAGLKPSLFYVDGDHTYHGVFTDLALINSLFPDVTIFGDDWNFTSSYPRYRGIDYSVQKAAKDFAEHTSRPLEVFSNTYVIGVRAAETKRYA